MIYRFSSRMCLNQYSFKLVTILKKTIIVGVVYRPNTQPLANLDFFIEKILEIHEIILNENKIAYLMGDYNINLLNFSTHIKTNDFLDNVISQGFVPQIIKPTRITSASATLIDHIYCNYTHTNCDSGIIITDIAAYFGVFHITYENMKVENQKWHKKYMDCSATSKQKEFRKLPQTFVINGNETSCPENIAEEFNNCFVGIGESLGKSIPLPSGTFHNYLNGHYPTNFFMRPTDALEIITITNTLNKKRSSGFDNISTIILCSTIDEIATPLAHIINQSFTQELCQVT